MSLQSAITKVGVLALAAAASVSAGPVSIHKRGLSLDTIQNDMIQAHNFFRRQHDAPDVTWSDDAAAVAQNWANGCLWQHQGADGYGENLAGGGYDSFYHVVDSWAHERTQYDFNNPGWNPDAGHFTQVVWKGTSQIGCGYAECGDDGSNGRATGAYIVCEYAPPGNIVGNDGQYFRDNVTPQTSGSPEDSSAP